MGQMHYLFNGKAERISRNTFSALRVVVASASEEQSLPALPAGKTGRLLNKRDVVGNCARVAYLCSGRCDYTTDRVYPG